MKERLSQKPVMAISVILSQMALLLGCGGAGPGRLALEATEQAGAAAPDGGEGRSATGLWEGVRVSREYFQQPLESRILLRADALPEAEVGGAGRSEWTERPPTRPIERPGYLADFRDHQACASFAQSGSVQLCFLVGGDVSTVEINRRKVEVEGLAEELAREVGCEVRPESVRFVDSERTDAELRVRFEAEAPCVSAGPVQVSLELRPL